MAVSEDYMFVDEDKLRDKLKWSFRSAFEKNENFEQLKAVNTIADWYKDINEFKEKGEGNNKHIIRSTIANKTIEELVRHVEPFYKNTIIKNIGTKTQFKEGTVERNFNTNFVSIKPYVKFVKRVNLMNMHSVKFSFLLNTNIYIETFLIHSNPAGKSIDINRLSIELELSLLEASISMQTPYISLNEPIILTSKRFEIDNLSFHSKKTTY
jgi:hypothetical protein